MFVATSMAEIVSAIPTSGGPYFWAAILAPEGMEGFFAWVTGWSVLRQECESGWGSLTSTGSIS